MFSLMETKQWDPSRSRPVHLWLILTCLLSLHQNISMNRIVLSKFCESFLQIPGLEVPCTCSGDQRESSLAGLWAKVKTLHHTDELHPNAILFIRNCPHAWRNLKPSQDEKHLRHRYYGVTSVCQAESRF